MDRTLSRRLEILLVAALMVVSAGTGYAVSALALHGAPAPGPSEVSHTLWISAAGTLGAIFPKLANDLANLTPGISVPTASQQYQGSIAAIQAAIGHSPAFDIVASADYRLIPRLMEPGQASWEAIFATTPEVLAYDPSVSALSGITTANWTTKLEATGVTLGVANASVDPNGYNAIFVLELEGLLENGNASSVYGHFFSTPPGSLALANPTTARVEPEAQAATLLTTHEISAFLIYRSYAIQHHLSYVDLDPRVNLGNLSTSAITFDARASTMILGGAGGTTVLRGAPIAFAVTVPTPSTNATLGALFVHLLLSPRGVGELSAAGFTPVFPGWADKTALVPPLLAPDVVAMPSSLPAP
ncbi:MAG: substrate-binding domain-containing protein [Thermoplasmata archaeon]|nr:substrate-binding domain-containing protein [Thermoplasmata archaeon]